MKEIKWIKSISIWIFIIPFLSVNFCLIFNQSFPSGEGPFAIGDTIADKASDWIIPYIDGNNSISRVVRVFPNSLIFKPSMIITSILLIFYWIYNAQLIKTINSDHKHIKKILFFGIGSAIFLSIHSIFLGIKLDISIFKLLRRVVLLAFIVFEIVAQAFLIVILFNIKNKISHLINEKILKIKRILVTILILVAIITIPFLPFNNLKTLKYLLEWNYFLGVILFYLLTFLMWKKPHSHTLSGV